MGDNDACASSLVALTGEDRGTIGLPSLAAASGEQAAHAVEVKVLGGQSALLVRRLWRSTWQSHVERVTGAAQRRREWRQRSWWRHEQQSVAAALASARHHSAGPVVEEVVTRQEGREEKGGLRGVRSPTETDETSSGDAAGCSCGRQAAACGGSHVVRGCCGSFAVICIM